jgi:choline dehydrogenase-like flavoprotein
MVCARRRFGKCFRAELKGSSRIRVLTHATATRLDTDEAGRKIIGVEALSESGRRLTVDSAIVVLAAGAIENARLMLLSNEQFPTGNRQWVRFGGPILHGPSTRRYRKDLDARPTGTSETV